MQVALDLQVEPQERACDHDSSPADTCIIVKTFRGVGTGSSNISDLEGHFGAEVRVWYCMKAKALRHRAVCKAELRLIPPTFSILSPLVIHQFESPKGGEQIRYGG